MLAASYVAATMAKDDPRANLDIRELAVKLMQVTEEVDRVIIADHYDAKKRHWKVIPRNPWNRAEFIEIGRKLGLLLDQDTYYQEVKAPEVQRPYTRRMAHGPAIQEYLRNARQLEQ
jgi:hypothetical protein